MYTLMFLPSFIMIERDSDGAHILKLIQGGFSLKTENINGSKYADRKLALVLASRFSCGVQKAYINCDV